MAANRYREAHTRSFAKAISWRITGSVDTFLLSWLISGNLKIAGGIAGTEMITKIVLYYLHERAWHIVPWGRPQHPELTAQAQSGGAAQ
jgi:uncharacterized membrane protein